MAGGKAVVVALAALAWLVLLPGSVHAQSTIAGVVKDTSGGVMPGVTVEASSPALIEKVRVAVTDESGQYRIIELRPGVYTVSFTLAGFATTKREGIELPSNFTATINAELRVGGLEETLTVTGESPMVDTQSAVSQQLMSQKLLDLLPTGGRNYQSVGALLVGVAQNEPDVGGTAGMQQNYLTAHGADARDNAVMVDGIRLNSMESTGANQNYFNEGMFVEMAYQTGAIPVDTTSGGIKLNLIPKDGGNALKSDLFFSMTNQDLQAGGSNPDPRMQQGNSVDAVHDFNLSVGGPVKRDRLWFFTSFRHWGVNSMWANSFYPLSSGLTSFTPDTTRQVKDDNVIKSGMFRLTYRMNQEHKLAGYVEQVKKWRGHEQQSGGGVGGSVWSEESFGVRIPKAYYVYTVKWTGTLSSNLMVEAGFGMNNKSYSSGELQDGLLETNPIPKVEITTGAYWGAPSGPYYPRQPIRYSEIGAVSYVTGSHAFKVGVERSHGSNHLKQWFQNNNINFTQRFQRGLPNSVVIYLTPLDQTNSLDQDLGIYLQDSWKIKRLTLTPGLRFESLNGSYPAQSVPENELGLLRAEGYSPVSSYPERKNLPDWSDVAPRIGMAYDLFRDGKTAVKASFSKYMLSFATDFSQRYNPMAAGSDTRTWTDLNNNLIYDPGVDRLGVSSNQRFGQTWREPASGIKRPYHLEYTTSIQQQLRSGVSVSLAYFRRTYARMLYSYNPAIGVPGAFTPITIANPCLSVTDPLAACGGRFPDTVTVYSIRPELSGVGTITDDNSTNNARVFNGVDLVFTTRFGRGTIFGGVSTSRQVSRTCDVTGTAFNAASNPNQMAFCDQTKLDIPFLTQFKINGSYELPAGFVVSGSFQSYPGNRDTGSGDSSLNWQPVNYTANPSRVPGLTQGSETIALIYPGSKYLDRLNQLDLRISRRFRFGRLGEFLAQVDLFNVLNAHTATATTSTFGSALNTPTADLQSRLVSIGAQWHF